MRVDPHARIVGELLGVPLKRYSKDHGGKNSTDWWTHTVYTLKAPLPAFMVARNKNLLDSLTEAFGTKDIQLGSELDPKLWIRSPKGREDTVRRLLMQPDVERGLKAIVDADIRLALKKQELTLLFRGHHLRVGDRGLALGAQLVSALDRAIGDPWQILAEVSTLTLNAQKTCLEGHYGGVAIRAEIRPPKEKKSLHTRIYAWIDPPLPADTSVRHKAKLTDGHELDDAILDKMVRAKSSDLAALRERICTDDARGPLLEILHGHPNSKLGSDKIMLWVRGHVGVDLQAHVDNIVDFVQAIGGGR